MKISFSKSKIYLVLAYIAVALLVRLIFTDVIGTYTLWQPLIYTMLLLFIILSYETLLKTIQHLTGDISENELDAFSQVLELNKKIQGSMDPDKVLRLIEVALKNYFGANHVLIYLNENIETEEIQLAKHKGKTKTNSVKVWPYSANAVPLSQGLVDEIIKYKEIFIAKDKPTFAELLFHETQTDLAIPVIHDGQLLALTLVSHFSADTFYLQKEQRLQILGYLANQLALILDRIQMYQQVMLQTAMDHAEKMQVMQSISSNIAHEMRTPLSGIRASVSGVEEYLPDLTRAYEYCQKVAPEDFPPIREDHLKGLNSTLSRITLMIDQANTVIDMLLMNLRETSLDENQMNVCSAAECVTQVIDRYPFKSGELDKVELDLSDNFRFLGIESLFIYVIFNLLKNSLHSIRSAQKGKIYITLATAKQIDPLSPLEYFNVIYFRDTGKGIDPEIIDKVFDSFFTTKEGGTGAGLAYCKRTIKSFNGRISCESLIDEFCEFTISFPALGSPS